MKVSAISMKAKSLVLYFILAQTPNLWFECEMSPHRLMCFKAWSPARGAVWGCYGTFRRYSLTRGRMSEVWGSVTWPHFLCSFCFLCADSVISQLPAAAAMCFPLWWFPVSSFWKWWARINPFSTKLLFSGCFITATERKLICILSCFNFFFFFFVSWGRVSLCGWSRHQTWDVTHLEGCGHLAWPLSLLKMLLLLFV